MPLREILVCLGFLVLPAMPAPAQPAPAPAASGARRTIDARPWPRRYTIGEAHFAFYRPQLEGWSGNSLTARAVMTVKTGSARDGAGKMVDAEAYGVIWLGARTEIDKSAREVVLTDLVVNRASFPAHREREQAWLALARAVTPTTDLVASLDQIETTLAISASMPAQGSLPVGNAPPEIIFSAVPAVLVAVDGKPVWKPGGIAGVERLLNSRALLLRYGGGYYLGYGKSWARANALEGPWRRVAAVAPPLLQAMEQAVAAGLAPAPKDVPADIADAFRNGQLPAVYLRTRPSELIVTEGPPEFRTIAGTRLRYVSNTPADIFSDANGRWYVLISGRWFAAASAAGPWRHVAQSRLPGDFAHIPPDGPKGAVLASVAGTPQAREAVIANSIPQTATVDRGKATFQARYDGRPRFAAIGGTKLSYVLNSAAPIINVPGAGYYALYDGVWFRSDQSDGPWAVPSFVPAAIYAIPTSSPVHYVTYARVYSARGNEVYVGYTPGYYGTVVTDNVVVYGTGYACTGWVGEVWHGCPATYGYGAALSWGALTGWALSFGWGWYDPWYDPRWGPWAGNHSGYYYPWAFGGAVTANVYGHWGNSVVGGTAAAWANPRSGNIGRVARGAYNPVTGGRGYGYAGPNTNAYLGIISAAAGGVRYNPQPGRMADARGGGNARTADGDALRTVVNINSGAVTRTGRAVSRSPDDASGGAGRGRGVTIRYDRDTGEINHGGMVDVNGRIYAGRDGNVYRCDENGWSKAGANDHFVRSPPAPGLDMELLARTRGVERDLAGGNGFERSNALANFAGLQRISSTSFGGGGMRFSNGR